MISINLLGEEKSIDIAGRLILAGFFLGLGLFVFVMLGYSASLASKVSELDSQKAQLNAELSALAAKTKAVRDLEQKRTTIKEKLAIIARLKKSKIGPVRLLDDLNIQLPGEVWLLELSEVKNKLKLKGRALSNQDVARYMESLTKSEYIVADSINLQETRQMYYDRETGSVTSSKGVESFKSADFGSNKGRKRTAVISENGERRQTKVQKKDERVSIKEFVIQLSVNYAGKVQVSDSIKEEEKKKKKKKK